MLLRFAVFKSYYLLLLFWWCGVCSVLLCSLCCCCRGAIITHSLLGILESAMTTVGCRDGFLAIHSSRGHHVGSVCLEERPIINIALDTSNTTEQNHSSFTDTKKQFRELSLTAAQKTHRHKRKNFCYSEIAPTDNAPVHAAPHKTPF